MGVVKANAYGHGILEISKIPGPYALAFTTPITFLLPTEFLITDKL
jgi:hypothetical protein